MWNERIVRLYRAAVTGKRAFGLAPSKVLGQSRDQSLGILRSKKRGIDGYGFNVFISNLSPDVPRDIQLSTTNIPKAFVKNCV